VTPGQTITGDEAEAFLRSDLAWAEKAVQDAIEITLTPNQFSALVSFTFNTGASNETTLFRIVNDGVTDPDQIRTAFGLWVYAGGRVLAGLVRRRAAEARLFLS
jgi:GH24 family phage-related lysozyme (muramidase)